MPAPVLVLVLVPVPVPVLVLVWDLHGGGMSEHRSVLFKVYRLRFFRRREPIERAIVATADADVATHRLSGQSCCP